MPVCCLLLYIIANGFIFWSNGIQKEGRQLREEGGEIPYVVYQKAYREREISPSVKESSIASQCKFM